MTDSTQTPQASGAEHTIGVPANPQIVVTELSPTRVTGHVDLGPEHHTPYGTVHGGVYCTIVESLGSMAGGNAVAERGQCSVGVHNATDFIRPFDRGRALVAAEAIQQGRTQQLWLISITAEESGKLLARGHLRLHNVDLPQSS